MAIFLVAKSDSRAWLSLQSRAISLNLLLLARHTNGVCGEYVVACGSAVRWNEIGHSRVAEGRVCTVDITTSKPGSTSEEASGIDDVELLDPSVGVSESRQGQEGEDRGMHDTVGSSDASIESCIQYRPARLVCG